MKKFTIFIFVFVFTLFPNNARAADRVALESQMKELTQTVRDLKLVVEAQQREIDQLKGQQPSPVSETSTTVFQSGGSKSLQGRWNPDIGMLADTALLLDTPRQDAEGADRVSVRALELILGSAVDPYSRLDVDISFSDFEAVAVEEAYLTRFDLPWDTQARIGRFKPRVGKALPIHRDSLDTVDEPLVIQRYFGVEGLSKTGVDIVKSWDGFKGWTHEASTGILEGGNGEGGTVFGSARRIPTFYGHLKNYLDVNEATGVELGTSYLLGSRDNDSTFETDVLGFDGTLIYRFADQQHIKLQGEVFNIFFENVDGKLWGGYALVDFKFHPQWSTGFRFDDVELVDNPIANKNKGDVGYTTYLTFYQSEFARWRGQISHINLATGKDDNQFLIQGTFAIGEHKHKLQ